MIRLNKEKGFSLVEIMLVVSLILIILSFITLALVSMKNSTREVSVLSDMKNFQTQASIIYSLNGFGDPVSVGQECDSSLFADGNISRIMDFIKRKTGGNISCAVGTDGQSYSFSVDSDEMGSICVTENNIIKNAVATGGGGLIASCQ